MGDTRFARPYEQVKKALGRLGVLRSMPTEDVIAALAEASRQHDPRIANVLATEALNRVRREGAAMDRLGHGVYVLDATGRVAYVNPAATAMLGREAADLVGQPSRDAIGLKDTMLSPGRASGPDEIVLASGHRVGTETGVLSPAGQAQMFVVYIAVPMMKEGVVTGVVVSMRDITARRRAEVALAQSAENHRKLLDAIPDAILVIDRAGLVRYANPAANALFGQAAARLVGVSLGVPAVSSNGTVVDVSTTGGTWRLARLRTVESRWEDEPAFVSIYSHMRGEP